MPVAPVPLLVVSVVPVPVAPVPEVVLVPLVDGVVVPVPVVSGAPVSLLPRVVSRLQPAVPKERASTANAVAPVSLSWLSFMIFLPGIVTLTAPDRDPEVAAA